jgi:signal transduction histidine kinase
MNGIIGMTDLALQTDLTADQRECMETVKLSADSLIAVINDILDFSKMEAGRIELEAIDFQLRDCLDSTLRMLALRAEEKGLRLLSVVAPDVPDVLWGDSGRLRQVLINLVGNAIKFTPHGEVAVNGQLTMLNWRCTSVSTGIGIPLAKQQSISIVQPGRYLNDEGRWHRLGLTISARLIQLMGTSLGREPGRTRHPVSFHRTPAAGDWARPDERRFAGGAARRREGPRRTGDPSGPRGHAAVPAW